MGIRTVGNYLDTVAERTLFAMAKRLLEGKGAVKGLPANAALIQVAGGAAAWELSGAWVVIDDGTGVLVDSTLIGFNISTPSDGAIEGAISFAYGAGNVAVATAIHFEVATDAGVIKPVIIGPTVRIPAGSPIKAKLATLAGGAESVYVGAIIKPV